MTVTRYVRKSDGSVVNVDAGKVQELEAEVARLEKCARDFESFDRHLAAGYAEKAAEAREELAEIEALSEASADKTVKTADPELVKVVRAGTAKRARILDRLDEIERQRHGSTRPIGMPTPRSSSVPGGSAPVVLGPDRMSNEQKAAYFARQAQIHADAGDRATAAGYREKAAEARQAARDEQARGAGR